MACSQIIYGFNARGACKIVGGVKTVYLTNSENITAVGTTGPSPVTQINSFTYATGGLWYEFNQIQETSSLTMTPNANVQNRRCSLPRKLPRRWPDPNPNFWPICPMKSARQ